MEVLPEDAGSLRRPRDSLSSERRVLQEKLQGGAVPSAGLGSYGGVVTVVELQKHGRELWDDADFWVLDWCKCE